MKKTNFAILFKLFLLLTLAVSTACSRKAKNETHETDSFYTIPFAEIIKNQREVKLSEFANEVEFIQLENTPEALIGGVFDLKLTKDYIFINSGRNPVMQFSRDGKYLQYIGKTGRGPGEYDLCRKLSVDEKNELIYIQANANRSMLVYNFNGEHIKTIRYPAMERLSNVWSRDSLLVSFQEPMEGNEPYVFMEHNEPGDTLQAIVNQIFWNNDEQYYNMYLNYLKAFYRFDDKLHMKGWYNDTVYTYDENNKIAPKFFIDLKEHKLPDDLIYERKWTRMLPDNLCWVDVLETSNYIFIPYGYHFDIVNMKPTKEEEGCVLYNKKTKEGVAVEEAKQWGFFDDIFGGPDFKPIYTNDTLAIMPISSAEMKMYLESNEFKNRDVILTEEKEKLIQLNKTLKEEDNHFVVLAKLKE
ncbi:6-bladed beta-propeller protein [Tangfeifania diversioriginum]|uniref:6-bladed beta-propeller protein n=1 Tax=Tangfeifania diversioriginum TaxID=1168035 RepID=A0A1M6NTI9_9BACT|nr:6-bladed beta-propeller [Tangfeifania diversioriginum]SHJ99041.1 6-bladed beta-propeller protein [Tangfeifania diversioriginum]